MSSLVWEWEALKNVKGFDGSGIVKIRVLWYVLIRVIKFTKSSQGH